MSESHLFHPPGGMLAPDSDPSVLRVATYNIHKGVQGLGPARRLEIHNLALAVETLDADIVCLQEVRRLNHREAGYFTRWPELPQADFLAPEGYEAVYVTNAFTRHGEHGNALLSRWPVIGHRHEDMSDHRFEQRGLLHVEVGAHGDLGADRAEPHDAPGGRIDFTEVDVSTWWTHRFHGSRDGPTRGGPPPPARRPRPGSGRAPHA